MLQNGLLVSWLNQYETKMFYGGAETDTLSRSVTEDEDFECFFIGRMSGF